MKEAILQQLGGKQAGQSHSLRIEPYQVYGRYRNLILGSLSVVFFLIAWEWGSRVGFIDIRFFSSPFQVANSLNAMINDGSLFPHLYASGLILGLGFGLAVVSGIPLGIVIGWYPTAYGLLNPFVAALYATPRIALLPLFILLLGIGIWSRTAIVFLSAFFPILVITVAAIRTLEEGLLRVARSFGAGDWDIFRTVALPSSVPFILAGLRLAAGRALLGMVVAEFFMGNEGLGFLIAHYGSIFATDKLFVAVTIVAFFSILLFELLRVVEKKFEPWRPGRDEQV